MPELFPPEALRGRIVRRVRNAAEFDSTGSYGREPGRLFPLVMDPVTDAQGMNLVHRPDGSGSEARPMSDADRAATILGFLPRYVVSDLGGMIASAFVTSISALIENAKTVDLDEWFSYPPIHPAAIRAWRDAVNPTREHGAYQQTPPGYYKGPSRHPGIAEGAGRAWSTGLAAMFATAPDLEPLQAIGFLSPKLPQREAAARELDAQRAIEEWGIQLLRSHRAPHGTLQSTVDDKLWGWGVFIPPPLPFAATSPEEQARVALITNRFHFARDFIGLSEHDAEALQDFDHQKPLSRNLPAVIQRPAWMPTSSSSSSYDYGLPPVDYGLPPVVGGGGPDVREWRGARARAWSVLAGDDPVRSYPLKSGHRYAAGLVSDWPLPSSVTLPNFSGVSIEDASSSSYKHDGNYDYVLMATYVGPDTSAPIPTLPLGITIAWIEDLTQIVEPPSPAAALREQVLARASVLDAKVLATDAEVKRLAQDPAKQQLVSVWAAGTNWSHWAPLWEVYYRENLIPSAHTLAGWETHDSDVRRWESEYVQKRQFGNTIGLFDAPDPPPPPPPAPPTSSSSSAEETANAANDAAANAQPRASSSAPLILFGLVLALGTLAIAIR